MTELRRVADRLVAPNQRARVRERLAVAGTDLLVGVAVLLAALVVAGVAAVVLGTLVLGGGVLGIVVGWAAVFGLALLIPAVAMKVGGALYVRFAG